MRRRHGQQQFIHVYFHQNNKITDEQGSKDNAPQPK